MLPARHRLRRPADFRAVVRGAGSARAGGPLLVVHARWAATGDEDLGAGPPRVGFVVSKAVGNAVTRNRTKRVLRHLVFARLARLPDGLDLVVRALPAVAGRATPEVGAELDRSLTRVLDRVRVGVPPAGVTL